MSEALERNWPHFKTVAKAAGGADELEAAFDCHSSALFRYALGVTGSREDAEDAVQDVFTRMARSGGPPCREPKLTRYLFRAVRNAAISALRKARRQRTEPMDADIPGGEQPGQADEALRDAVMRLPMEQREVIALKVLQQMTFEEVGRTLGISPNTAASRYRYAITRLRADMGDANNG